MSTSAEHLRTIKTFPSLVKYLRDELEWPIDSEKFDDLTFEYQPEELGLNAKTAVKIKEIKQLRPLVTNQPWGIFFINFEPKSLPVIALRRILSHLVIKKRKSSNQSERPAWAPHDLLFISSYGEADHRDITFAQFSEGDSDLPALRVLSWDDEDTAAHLGDAHKTLKEKLRWPADSSNLTAWRTTWSAAFTLQHREVINTSKSLAVRLAKLATAIRKRVNKILQIESEKGSLRMLHASFKEALIHDLKEDDFADMYAQTITYGMLSARVSRPAGLVAENIADMVPVTNPFLRDLLSTFLTVGGRKGKIDFDEVGINEVVQVLRDANMEAVLRDFGDRNPQEDPVVHFYELFLKEYDPRRRMQRGVFYTPRPVVSYIVRSVDEILRKECGLADGLADTTTWGQMIKRHPGMKIPEGAKADDTFVQILDPATGTGTFLVEVIDVIHKTMVAKWTGDRLDKGDIQRKWNEYISDHLLPRLYGFELMMAPYAVAHMKIGLKLHDTGYDFKSHERARIYLTNSLEPAHGFSGQLELDAPALAHEAQAVNEIKAHKRFTVVIGNPPYSPSICEPEWLMRRLDDWKEGLNETKSDLNREEWKFLRLAQHHCQTTGAGIIGFIINRDFLDGIVKRRMRQHLGQTFPLRIAVDLNGDVKGNIADENVFEIEQGVAIAVLSTKSVTPCLRFSSRVGKRSEKYADLVAKTPIDAELITIEPTTPYFRWVPSQSDAGIEQEYLRWIALNEVFPIYSSGIQTKRDGLCVQFDKATVWSIVCRLHSLSVEVARREFDLGEDGRDWTVAGAKADIVASGPHKRYVTPLLYRPFDMRFTYWTGQTKGFLAYPRRDVMQHILGQGNVGLIFNRQIVGDSISHFGVSRIPICHGTFYLGNKGQDYFAPLFVHTDQGLFSKGSSHSEVNFSFKYLSALAQCLTLSAKDLFPEDIFNAIYATLYSPGYRSRYEEFLKRDFPRIPLTATVDLFRALARLGGELVALHLMESPKLDKSITKWRGNTPSDEIEKVIYSDETVWLDKAKTSGFKGVAEPVWNFHIGGYQVCEKWLKDRKGRKLSREDIEHYQKIVVALNETIRLMKEIDEVIEKHGGWPGAFQK